MLRFKLVVENIAEKNPFQQSVSESAIIGRTMEANSPPLHKVDLVQLIRSLSAFEMMIRIVAAASSALGDRRTAGTFPTRL